jgi:amino acid transporter
MGRLLVGSRIPFVMGRDGFLPRFIQKQNVHGAPWVSLAICASIYSVIAVVFDDFALLASFVVFFYGGVLTLEFAALFILRLKQPNLERPFKIPGGWPVLILLLILPLSVLTIAIYSQISEAESLNSIMVAIVLMVSVPLLYPVAAWWKRKNNIPDDDALDN